MALEDSPRIVTHEFWPFRGGVASFCRDLAGGFVARGGTPTVHAPELAGGREDQRFPFAVERYRGSGRLTVGGLWAARRAWVSLLARDDRPIVLASYGAITGAAFGPDDGGSRGVVAILHGSEVLKWRQNRWLGPRVKRLLKRCRAILTNSEFTRAGLMECWPESMGWPSAVLPLAPGSTAMGEVRVRAKDELGRVRILLLARIHPRKGQVEFLRACGRLTPTVRKQVVVQIAGTGREGDVATVQRTAAEVGVATEFLGEVPDEELASVYAQCDLYALTPITLGRSVEGFGLTFLEAGAHGKAVIGFRSGGVGEAVVDGKTGLLVDEGDLEGLAAGLERLVVDERLRESLGAEGRKRARSRSWEAVAAIVAEALAGTRGKQVRVRGT
ncbi:MAG: glycosyltransferase family 4 protein [Verrucomicrobiia bacterium]